VLGGYLALAGSDVVLVGRPEHIRAIRKKGLLLKDRDNDHVIHIQAVASVEALSLQRDDIILLSTKSQDTAEIVTTLERRVSPQVPIFCFQNGVRNEQLAARHFANVYGVLVAIGGSYLAPGQVAHYASRAVAMGRYPQGIDDTLRSVRQALEAAGCTVTLSPRIMAVKWSKLIINLCNAFYAVTDLSIPEAHRLQESRSYLADIMEEGVRVLDAAGVDYQPIPGKGSLQEELDILRQPQAVQPWPEDPDFDYYPSTWQDLKLGRGSTETAFLNGEIITLGRQNGIPTPLNELLLSLVEDMATRQELPGKYSVQELRNMQPAGES
jgi:2-dehydropantoate 2-reductase